METSHEHDTSEMVITDSGTRLWRSTTTGRLHRLDGPAVITADGRCVWCLDGRRIPAPERGSTGR